MCGLVRWALGRPRRTGSINAARLPGQQEREADHLTSEGAGTTAAFGRAETFLFRAAAFVVPRVSATHAAAGALRAAVGLLHGGNDRRRVC